MTPSPLPRKERSEEQSADRCKDAGTTQQSGEKGRGRDKARKRRGASGGGSSSGARPRAGSSSPSASGRSGRCSGPRSSSSSSAGSPRPWRPETTGGDPVPNPSHPDETRRAEGAAPPLSPPKCTSRGSPGRWPGSTSGRYSPPSGGLERSTGPEKGCARIRLKATPTWSSRTRKRRRRRSSTWTEGIDGRLITATAVLAPRPQPPPRRLSPPRRMLPPLSTWRRLRSRSRSPWGRSLERGWTCFPCRPVTAAAPTPAPSEGEGSSWHVSPSSRAPATGVLLV